MLFLLAYRRHRAVSRTNDCFIWERQNLFKIVLKRIIVGDISTAHRTGEKRIAYDSDAMRETAHYESHSALRVAPGQQTVDFQCAKAKTFSIFDQLRPTNRFTCRRKDHTDSYLAKA